MVAAPRGYPATAKYAGEVPSRRPPANRELGIPRGLGCGTGKEVVVVAFRHISFVRVSTNRSHWRDRIDRVDLAEIAMTSEVGGPLERCRRTLLRTMLQHDAIAFHGLHHGASLFDRIGKRLVEVDVLTVLRRFNRHERVPVVRRSNTHDVNFRVGAKLAEVMIGLAVGVLVDLVDVRLRALRALRPYVADCDNADARSGREAGRVCPAPVSTAHDPYIQRTGRSLTPKQPRRNNQRRRGKRRAFQKMSSIQLHLPPLGSLSSSSFNSYHALYCSVGRLAQHVARGDAGPEGRNARRLTPPIGRDGQRYTQTPYSPVCYRPTKTTLLPLRGPLNIHQPQEMPRDGRLFRLGTELRFKHRPQLIAFHR